MYYEFTTSGEAKRSKANALRNCGPASSIYEAGNHRMCVFKLFRGDKKKELRVIAKLRYKRTLCYPKLFEYQRESGQLPPK